MGEVCLSNQIEGRQKEQIMKEIRSLKPGTIFTSQVSKSTNFYLCSSNEILTNEKKACLSITPICLRHLISSEIDIFAFTSSSNLLMNLFLQNKIIYLHAFLPNEIKYYSNVVLLMGGEIAKSKNEANYIILKKYDFFFKGDKKENLLVSNKWLDALFNSSEYIAPIKYQLKQPLSEGQKEQMIHLIIKEAIESCSNSSSDDNNLFMSDYSDSDVIEIKHSKKLSHVQGSFKRSQTSTISKNNQSAIKFPQPPFIPQNYSPYESKTSTSIRKSPLSHLYPFSSNSPLNSPSTQKLKHLQQINPKKKTESSFSSGLKQTTLGPYNSSAVIAGDSPPQVMATIPTSEFGITFKMTPQKELSQRSSEGLNNICNFIIKSNPKQMTKQANNFPNNISLDNFYHIDELNQFSQTCADTSQENDEKFDIHYSPIRANQEMLLHDTDPLYGFLSGADHKCTQK